MRRRLKDIVVIFLILVSPLTSLAQEDAITVTVTVQQIVTGVVSAPPDQSGDPGDTLVYTFSVQNIGNGPDVFNLSAKSQERWSVNLPAGDTTGILAAGEAQLVDVELTIPSDEMAGTQDTLTLTATSQTDRKVSGNDSVNTTVNQVAGVAVTIANAAQFARPGDTITYRFTVENTGNGLDSFTLTAVSSSGWPVAIVGGNYIGPIEPGKKGAVQVEIQLTVPPTAADGETDTLTFTATSNFNPLISSQAQATTTVRIRGGR